MDVVGCWITIRNPGWSFAWFEFSIALILFMSTCVKKNLHTKDNNFGGSLMSAFFWTSMVVQVLSTKQVWTCFIKSTESCLVENCLHLWIDQWISNFPLLLCLCSFLPVLSLFHLRYVGYFNANSLYRYFYTVTILNNQFSLSLLLYNFL